jgi:serine protease Do
MRVGDGVFAIGSPFGFDTSVTAGIISAVNRDIKESPFDEYLQTDAAINHGNSGGPLFNRLGEVIGMNSVMFAPTPGSAGVGFAIPSSVLRFVFTRLIETGAFTAGMLPIHTQQVSWMLKEALGVPDLDGALVTSVQIPGETTPPGEIRPGDVVRTFNGQKVLDPRDLARKVARAPVGGDAVLGIYRNGVLESAHVTIEAWPRAQPIVLDNDRRRTPGLELVSGHGENGKPIVTVASVDPAGMAADSGMQKNDILVQVQQTPVSEPDQALRIFAARSSLNHHFVAVLVERDKKLFWLPLTVSE